MYTICTTGGDTYGKKIITLYERPLVKGELKKARKPVRKMQENRFH